jgi:glycosyltransferase involved in cell wall biosynthesis
MPTTASEISVVIPVYNGAEFLGEAIASVYAQTVAPSQVIVVNDGSTDDTESCVRTLATSLPSSFQWLTKSNGGDASARNAGLKLATGAYIAFLDHDDLWHPTKLERQLEHFASDPDLDLSFTGCSVLYSGDAQPPGPTLMPSVMQHENWDPNPAVVLDELLNGRCPIKTPSSVLVTHAALRVVTPFDEGLLTASDWQMYLQFAAARMKMGHIPDPLVEYRWHGGNQSRDKAALLEDLCNMYDTFFVDHASELPEHVRKRGRWWRSRWHMLAAIDAIQTGDKRRARRHILTAARIRPLSVRPGWLRMLGAGPPP